MHARAIGEGIVLLEAQVLVALEELQASWHAVHREVQLGVQPQA